MKREQREWRAVEALFKELIGASRQQFPRSVTGLTALKRRGVYVVYDRKGRGRACRENLEGQGRQLFSGYNHMHGQSSFASHHLKGDGSRLWREKLAFTRSSFRAPAIERC